RSVTPEQLMVVTFTEKAAQELTTRIANRLAEIGVFFNLNEMYLGTFHSICLRWLQDYRDYTRLKHNFTMMDEFDQHYFLYQRLKEYASILGVHHITGAHATSASPSTEADDDAAANDHATRYDPSRWERSEKLQRWINTVAEETLDPAHLEGTTDEALCAL